MLKLRVVQAEEGDCLIVAHGDPASPRHMLVDGGPSGIYGGHLRGELERIAARGGRIDIAVLSHVDTDHANGLLDLLAELRAQRDAGQAPVVAVDALWHNEFNRTEGEGEGGAIESRVSGIVQALGASGASMSTAAATVLGIAHGSRLALEARLLDLPLNGHFGGEPLVFAPGRAPLALDGIEVQVVGPTPQNLAELRREWLEWLDRQERLIEDGRVEVAAMADKSIPNLSSIQLLVRAGARSLLLTGDARGDHLLQALEAGGHLDADGRLHVDVFKVPHHGSDRNATRRFFERVTADTYVISANGKHGNPDRATLEWIIEAAADAGRKVELVLTNSTPDVAGIKKSHPPATWGYKTRILSKTKHALDVRIAG